MRTRPAASLPKRGRFYRDAPHPRRKCHERQRHWTSVNLAEGEEESGKEPRAEELCREALERDPVERSAFLMAVCQGDDDLRQAVESLIGARSPETETIARTSSQIAGSAPSGAACIAAPERISHYRIARKLGEGGMGIVYAAYDERLDRPVAIKMIRATRESREARTRFGQEARALARINHPRICQIFDFDEYAGVPFLVLELLEGQSLEDRLEAGAIAFEETLRIAREILEALAALHSLNIVHRDLKPSNVFLTPHGVKLLDFGLAQFARSSSRDAEGVTTTLLTAPGMVVGTLNYMAPEQVDFERTGPTADLFAAACVIYEMAASRRAFEGASAIDVLYQVKHSDPPPLCGSPAISAVYHVIARAMEKRPEDRYQSAREMLEALRAVDPSAGAGPQARSTPARRFIALPFRVLRRDADTDFLAHSLPEAIGNSLSSIDSLIVRSSLVAARFEGSDPKKVAVEANVDVILTGTLLRSGDQLRVTS